MIKGLAAVLFGYAHFYVEGVYPERFFNICATKQRDIWDIKHKSNRIYACTLAHEYKNLRSAARQTKVKMHLVKKGGMPFFIHRNRRRYGLVCGAVMFFTLLIFLSGFVWNIEINGNQKVSTNEVMTLLQQNGVKKGSGISSINYPNVRHKIMLQNDNIAWMSINPVGTTLFVDISETSKKDEKDKKTPCDLVAKCDGRITYVEVYTGDAKVKVGDAVVKGDTLVSGQLTYENGLTVIKHADAKIKAQTTKTSSTYVYFEQTDSIPTGKSHSRRVLEFFHLNIPVWSQKPFDDSKTVSEQSYLKIGSKSLPIGIKTTRYFEQTPIKTVISAKEAENIGTEQLKTAFAKSHPDVTVLSSTFSCKVEQNRVHLQGKFLCEEDITFEKTLLIF